MDVSELRVSDHEKCRDKVCAQVTVRDSEPEPGRDILTIALISNMKKLYKTSLEKSVCNGGEVNNNFGLTFETYCYYTL